MFAWKGFGREAATGVASVRTCQKLLPCPTEQMPASFKTDLLLARAESISDDWDDIVQRGKKLHNCSKQEVGNSEVKLQCLGRRVGWEEGGLSFRFYFSFS